MARIHTKRHGKSKSRKPDISKIGNIELPDTEKEKIKKIIESYAKQRISPAIIGEKLKKEHNVPYIKAMMGKRLVKILKEENLVGKLPQDLIDLMKRSVRLRKHLEKNKHDVYSKTRLQRVEAKILRVSRYYIKEKVLPSGWKYDPQRAELIIRGKA